MSETQILVVEDERITARNIQNKLKNLGYAVPVVASSGKEAVQKAAETRPELVLMDIRLKGNMNGIQAAEQIRTCFNIPVIYLTAYADEDTLQRAKVTEPYSYILKPFDVRELQTNIEIALYKHNMGRKLKEAEDTLRESEERHRMFIQQSVEAICLFDTETKGILEANPAFLNLLGYTAEEVRTLTIYDFIEHDKGSIDADIQRILTSGPITATEKVWRRKDGALVDVQLTASKIRQGGRDIIFVVARDITEYKRVQQRLQQQDSLAAIGQLVAGIAHDFNNLLTGIIGYSELLEVCGEVSESGKDDLKHIMDGGQRAAHLIHQILNFSRQSINQRQFCDLVPFLKETIKFLERTIPENIHIALEMTLLEMTPGEYLVSVDLTQMQRVLTNLAINARDAMPGGGELKFRLSRFAFDSVEQQPVPEMPPGEWIVLSVSDTGVGIPSEALPNIYTPFFTTKEPGQGTGLGLVQVCGIVKQHDGFIDVESQVGEGTTFIIYLPASVVEKETPEEKALEELPRGRGETILVVEDELHVLAAISKMLEHSGYQVLMAVNGQEGAAVYDKHKNEIVLVLTDMVMPVMGGMGLFHVLKEQNPDVKVVMMSGYPLGEEVEELLSQGTVGWVQKPVDFAKLSQLVNEALT